jgi:L-threonylcarbamoyladenylate synthase
VTNYVEIGDAGALDEAEAALRAGLPIVLPTDTVYGLAALPSATTTLYELKGRPESIPIAVLVDSFEHAQRLVETPAVAERLAQAFWPGPLTIVLNQRGAPATVGVRCPDHSFVRALARRVGPLPVTSANRHGAPTPVTAA